MNKVDRSCADLVRLVITPIPRPLQNGALLLLAGYVIIIFMHFITNCGIIMLKEPWLSILMNIFTKFVVRAMLETWHWNMTLVIGKLSQHIITCIIKKTRMNNTEGIKKNENPIYFHGIRHSWSDMRPISVSIIGIRTWRGDYLFHVENIMKLDSQAQCVDSYRNCAWGGGGGCWRA